MIRHVTLYQLKDPKERETLVQCLRELENCSLIVRNNVYLNIEKELSAPIFADVMHEAFFERESDAKAFPSSLEHLELVKETNGLLKSLMTFDYFEE